MSIQGEGLYAGLPMVFVRLQGCSVTACPLHASLCDTNWRGGTERDVEDVASEVRLSGLPCCVTGGEPTDQADVLEALLATRAAPWWMLQTSGAAKVRGAWQHLVVSPKVPLADLEQRSGEELKLIYEPHMTVEDLEAWQFDTHFPHRYLQPIWQRRKDDMPGLAALLLAAAHAGLRWRLSQQTHKLAGLR